MPSEFFETDFHCGYFDISDWADDANLTNMTSYSDIVSISGSTSKSLIVTIFTDDYYIINESYLFNITMSWEVDASSAAEKWDYTEDTEI